MFGRDLDFMLSDFVFKSWIEIKFLCVIILKIEMGNLSKGQ